MSAKVVYNLWKGMPDPTRLLALVVLCEDALEVWKTYAKTGKIEYLDSVVGMKQVVEDDLPEKVLRAVQRQLGGEILPNTEVQAIEKAYWEPIFALQNMDLEFPEAIEYAYYCLYNLFCLVFNKGDGITEHLVWNLAVSAQLIKGDDEDIDAVKLRWWKKVEDRGLTA